MGAGYTLSHALRSNAKVRPCLLPSPRVVFVVVMRYSALDTGTWLARHRGTRMPLPSPDAIDKARQRVDQAKARLDALNARIATEGRRLDTRRKIILGGLLLDAAAKDARFAGIVAELRGRINRDQDHKPFDGWSLPGKDR